MKRPPCVAAPCVAAPRVTIPCMVGLALALAACVSPHGAPTRGMMSPHAAAAASGRPATSSPQESGTSLVDNALAMLGRPYRYGGASPDGFDCSGLVEYAAAGAGIHLPRTALEQKRHGASIGRREVRAGDLVFMHLARKELHVGIAIDGERFVHAPSRGGRVRIDSLDTPPYARGFIQARRIIDAVTP